MTDIDLLALGCLVSFIAVGGAYVYLRDRYLESGGRDRPAKEQDRRRSSRTAA